MPKLNPQTITPERGTKRIHAHTVVYQDVVDITCAIRAMQGRSTRAIAQELGLSDSKAYYRISKAQQAMGTYFRSDYRSGQGALVEAMMTATSGIAEAIVRKKIAPKFAKLASNRVQVPT
jgi:hypothetical protein